jgi:thiamine pyrophosphate-dependent acetolactate synthase large subunit-like protein
MKTFDDSIEAARHALENARRPLLLLGPEAAPVAAFFVELADRLGAAILTTPDGLSLVDGARAAGVCSFGASKRARLAVERSDVVLAVSSLGEFSCRLGEAFTHHVLIHVTDRVSFVGRNREPSVAIVGPLDVSVARLSAALAPSAKRHRWFEALDVPNGPEPRRVRAGLIHPDHAIAAIQAALPARARLCLDVTSGAIHAYQNLCVTPEQRVFSSIENSACMGEGLLASLGVRLASGLPTLAVVGDWGACMTPAEVHTAVELGVGGYVVVVWANQGGALVGAGVRQQGIAVPEAAWRFTRPPDFAGVARGYGARGVIVTDAAALELEISAGLAAAQPFVIEARIDPEVTPPAGDRFLTLGDTRAKLSQHRLRVSANLPSREPNR